MHRFAVLLIAPLALLPSCSTVPPPAPVAPPEPVAIDSVVADPRVEVLWDNYGVPHIYADDPAALFYAHGWSQMRSHADLLLRLYGQARGRAAEYWGEPFVESDVWVRTNGIPARSREWLDAQPRHIREYLNAFAAGINDFAARNPDAVGATWRQVLPVEAMDVLAHQQRVLNYTFMANAGMVDAVGPPPPAPGSNGWAVAPARSESGNALLLANPHLPWGDVFTWYEAHLVLPDANMYGATFVGFPTLAIAFNENLGWTHTVNTIDVVDVYELTTQGDAYLFDGALRGFETEQQTLLVRQPDSTLLEMPLTVKKSVHGPVIGERDGRAFALRVAGLERPHLVEQFWDMMRAETRQEFENALSWLQLPMFTVIYADRAGEIMHVFNGAVPLRSRGDWRYWQGIVPGDSSSTLWTQAHDYYSLPRVLNPPSGWLQNANEPPWTTTLPFPLDPRLFPDYMAPPPAMGFRPQRSARMLAEDSRITFDELVAYKTSTRLEAADHLVQDVVAAARAIGDEDARAAADVLEAWDRTANADSRGAVLFAAFFRAMQRQTWPGGSPWDIGWTAAAPLATPDGLSDGELAASLLARAAQDVRALHGSLDVAWGAVHRLRRDSLDLPASGAPGALGSFQVLDFVPLPGDSTRFVATGGDSYIAAVEFSSPVRARTLLTYGNASQPGSPHRTDQLRLFARGELKTVWFTREDVEQHVVSREVF